LETSNLPVEQIVKRVGYHDASALTRQFKLHTKLTPNQYRQRYGLSWGPGAKAESPRTGTVAR
jgi:transcriptional regulator GlxA family with amidase domain